MIKGIFENSRYLFTPALVVPIQRASSTVISIMCGVSHRLPLPMPSGAAQSYLQTLQAGGIIGVAGAFLARVSARKFTVQVPPTTQWGMDFIGAYDESASVRHVFQVKSRVMPGGVQLMLQSELQAGHIADPAQAAEIIATTPVAPIKLVEPHMPGALPDALTLSNILNGLARAFEAQADEEGSQPTLDESTITTGKDIHFLNHFLCDSAYFTRTSPMLFLT